MQSAIGSAMFKSGFRGSKNSIVENLFIVSELEAAAAYVLKNNYKIKVENHNLYLLACC
jgi:hypothetical protein